MEHVSLEGQLSGKASTNPKCLIYVICNRTPSTCELHQKGLELFVLGLELLNPYLLLLPLLPVRQGIDTIHAKRRTLCTYRLLASTPSLALATFLTGAFHSSPRERWCGSSARNGHLVANSFTGIPSPFPRRDFDVVHDRNVCMCGKRKDDE